MIRLSSLPKLGQRAESNCIYLHRTELHQSLAPISASVRFQITSHTPSGCGRSRTYSRLIYSQGHIQLCFATQSDVFPITASTTREGLNGLVSIPSHHRIYSLSTGLIALVCLAIPMRAPAGFPYCLITYLVGSDGLRTILTDSFMSHRPGKSIFSMRVLPHHPG